MNHSCVTYFAVFVECIALLKKVCHLFQTQIITFSKYESLLLETGGKHMNHLLSPLFGFVSNVSRFIVFVCA